MPKTAFSLSKITSKHNIRKKTWQGLFIFLKVKKQPCPPLLHLLLNLRHPAEHLLLSLHSFSSSASASRTFPPHASLLLLCWMGQAWPRRTLEAVLPLLMGWALKPMDLSNSWPGPSAEMGWPRSTVKKGPQSNESYERENPWNRTISTVLWVHKKLPRSTVKLALPSNESYESKTGCNRTLPTVLWVPLKKLRGMALARESEQKQQKTAKTCTKHAVPELWNFLATK